MTERGIVLLSALLAINANALAQTAEEAATACTEAARLISEEEDLVGALDEAQWCVESLQQLKQQRTLTVFPESVDGYSGGELNNQSAMGMTIIERTYSLDDKRVEVALTTGIAGGGLAALAQLGMGMGAGSGQKMRIQKRTVIDMSDENGESKYMVQLKSGGMLTISSGDLDADGLLPFVKAFLLLSWMTHYSPRPSIKKGHPFRPEPRERIRRIGRPCRESCYSSPMLCFSMATVWFMTLMIPALPPAS
jgi:hypothetical protein